VNRVVWELDGRLLDVLHALEVGFERVETGAYVVRLPSRHREATLVWLIAGEQAVAVEAFVLHVIGVSDPGPLHRALLAKNLRLREVHFGVDDVGDVFLTGSLPHPAVDVATVDRLLGEVLQLLEESTPALLRAAYGDRLTGDPGLADKVRTDGAGRRPAGTPEHAARRDVRR
jgi:Putative bacterial sensory transduction regulator